ncbi:sensor histidine kinase [Sphingomonas kyeonggiensis]|uniref:histidine kinase n=1 Tax=Sphingomonas kyeonggiensis TaxID=1268553 RepID=A0A7W6JX72_9SPHN|nr:HAMP domain-containing sensor histidine kinase [Sphingomonas kyeonggiensis]MBB4101173.1 hypothetical protein [Sphingomonas kyeonggiensis]
MLPDRLRPRSVTGLAGVFGIVCALASVAIGIALYALASMAFNQVQDVRLAREKTRLLAPFDGHAPTVDVVAARIAERTHQRAISSIGHRLVDGAGVLRAGTVEFQQQPRQDGTVFFRQPGEAWEAARAVEFTLADGGHLSIVAESESIEDLGKVVWPLFGAALALSAVAGALASWLLGRSISSRLSAIGTTANAIIAGDYSRRVPVDSLGGTFAEQARTFNRMLDRIEALMDNLRQVSSDIAHDLRTPLTRLQATLRAAAESDLSESERAAFIAAAGRECDGVLSLFAALLRIGEVQAGRRRPQVASIQLDALVDDVVESYVPVFADSGRSLHLAECDRCSIRGDADLCNQLLVNLIENAQLHTPPGSATQVSLRRNAGAVLLTVRDNGVGIPAEDREDVLQRFVRLERSRSTPGHGLGLALVAAIAGFHEAIITLDDAKPGLIVRIEFPAID